MQVSSTNSKNRGLVAESLTIFVCITCRKPEDPEYFPRPGAILAARTAEAARGTEFIVKRVRCLANCTRGLSAALRREGAWSYVFGGLDPTNDAAALVKGAELLARAGNGQMPWRSRPSVLKSGLIARIPPLDFPEDQS